jgi:hypothetical protein
MINKYFAAPIVSVLVVVAVYSVVSLWVAVIDNYTLMKTIHDSENVCIAELVSKGIPRRDIVRTDGTCAFVIRY